MTKIVQRLISLYDATVNTELSKPEPDYSLIEGVGRAVSYISGIELDFQNASVCACYQGTEVVWLAGQYAGQLPSEWRLGRWNTCEEDG